MSFTPPKYGDFGKSLNDLFSKKFDYENKVTVKRTAANGLSVETGVVSAKNLSGSVKLVYKEKGLGEFEASHDTSGNLKGKAKFTNLAKGVVAILESTLNNTFKAKATVDYAQDKFAASADLTVAEAKQGAHNVNASLAGVVGAEGISLGAQLNFSNASGSFDTPDVNMGFNFAENDFQFSLVTETTKAGPFVRAKYFQQVSKDLQSGFQFDSDNTVTLGFENKLDNSTIWKNTLSTKGVINTAIQHTLANPRAQLNLAASFNTTNGFDWSAQKYGLGVTLGEL